MKKTQSRECKKGLAHLVVVLLQGSPESGADAEESFFRVLGVMVDWRPWGVVNHIVFSNIALDKVLQEGCVLRLGQESGEV